MFSPLALSELSQPFEAGLLVFLSIASPGINCCSYWLNGLKCSGHSGRVACPAQRHL